MKMILSIAFLRLLEKSGVYKCPENYLSLVHRQALIISGHNGTSVFSPAGKFETLCNESRLELCKGSGY